MSTDAARLRTAVHTALESSFVHHATLSRRFRDAFAPPSLQAEEARARERARVQFDAISRSAQCGYAISRRDREGEHGAEAAGGATMRVQGDASLMYALSTPRARAYVCWFRRARR